MYLRKILTTGVLALILSAFAPAKASADWLFTPFIGMNFGGSATFNNDVFGDFDEEFKKRVDHYDGLGNSRY